MCACVSDSGKVTPKKQRNSTSYEIFDPAVSMKMFKDLKAEVCSLSQQLRDFSERLVKLEGELEFKSPSLNRTDELRQGQSTNIKRTLLSYPESNRDYLKTLSCEQVQK